MNLGFILLLEIMIIDLYVIVDALFEDTNKAIVDFEDYLSGEGSFIKDLKAPEMIKYYRLIDNVFLM